MCLEVCLSLRGTIQAETRDQRLTYLQSSGVVLSIKIQSNQSCLYHCKQNKNKNNNNLTCGFLSEKWISFLSTPRVFYLKSLPQKCSFLLHGPLNTFVTEFNLRNWSKQWLWQCISIKGKKPCIHEKDGEIHNRPEIIDPFHPKGFPIDE